jgi:hypothetical protein
MRRCVPSGMNRILLVGLLMLAAYGGTSAGDSPEYRVLSCGDAFFYFVDLEGETLLTIHIPGLATEAAEAGEPITRTLSHADPALVITLQTGRFLDDAICDDVIENDPVVDTTHLPVAGTIVVTVTPSGDGGSPIDVGGIADLTVADLEFRRIGFVRDAVHLGLRIGWYPG